MKPLIITLDGPAGTGKSAVAMALAKRLSVSFLDTGAMYRGLTAHCLDSGIDPRMQPDRVLELARQVRIWFDWRRDPPRLHIDEKDMTGRLRNADTTDAVSDVAAMGLVRQVLVEVQRRIGRDRRRLVSEGRDQGSIVFADADAKFYLEASPRMRARRRRDQLRDAGIEADEQEILAQINQRDVRDASRKDGPLICPPDAMRVDTTDMTLEQVVDHLEHELRQHVGAAL